MKKLVLAAALATALPASAIDIQRWHTADGATVLLVERHENPIVDISVGFKGSGSAADPQGKSGTAEFAAALLINGTKKLDEEAFRARSEDLAIHIDSSADSEGSSVTMRSLSRSQTLQPALGLLRDSLAAPRYDGHVFKRTQEQAVIGLKQQLSNPDFIASRAASRLNYSGHPYSASAYQTEQTLRAITPADIKAFHKTHYARNNAVVSIVGDVNKKQADKIAREVLRDLPAKTEASAPIPPVNLRPAQTDKQPFAGKQSQIVLTMPLIKRDDPDYYALVLGNYILGGGGFDSRLMKKLRDEKGYVYGVSSSLMPLRESGPFAIVFSTEKANTADALGTAKQVLAEFIQNGPTAAELQQAKDNITGSFPLRFDTNSKLLGYLNVIGFYDLPIDWLDQYPKKIAALSAENVKSAWQHRVKAGDMNVVIVGE
ncbi:M16 family metallopeptidase [Neisseria wadsworthii]|uniref:M16 family peptidase n=1 Tax=Neisseria wadsworthii 9715 TaxID=1030841 RepID=G4CME9_9NEIS|nr:pitrilysin family protein [Neisseria wadsworthii]EGZ51095.1 M16 family peptidase [Neisseria wadsworthii 9715]QMT36294.1 insulinase family protein [Neisseria wadsworthii]